MTVPSTGREARLAAEENEPILAPGLICDDDDDEEEEEEEEEKEAESDTGGGPPLDWEELGWLDRPLVGAFGMVMDKLNKELGPVPKDGGGPPVPI